MNVEWDRKADPGSLGETAAVLVRSRPGGGLESASRESALAPTSPEANPAGTSEREHLERLGDALSTARPRVPEGEQKDLKRRVLEGARSGLAKLNAGEPEDRFTVAEHVGLEAVILTNGERPSLVVRDGFVDLTAPDVGRWGEDLKKVEAGIRSVVKSVGRIDVPVDPWFAGTCLVLAEGLVVTNRHVLEVIATQDGAGRWTLNWPDATSVDFVVEDGGPGHGGFKVTGVAFAGLDPINRTLDFMHLDMAILRVEPAAAGPAFPNPVTFETDLAKPTSSSEIYLLGFPAEPNVWVFGGTPPAGYETTQVISAVFNSEFGIKRLAPGYVTFGPGELPNDPKRWICAHDASTLAGNSGSCIADLAGDGVRVLGLHFGGVNRGQNWGHAVARLHDQLAAFPAVFA